MSDTSIPLAYRTLETHSPVTTSESVTQTRPMGLLATLGWGAAGILALIATWLVPVILSAATGTPIRMPYVYLPVDHMAVAAVVALALWMSGRAFRSYLALEPIRWGIVARSVGYGLVAYVAFVFLLGFLTTLLNGSGHAAGAPAGGKVTLNSAMILFLVSYWTLLVVAAPIVEEMLFRGLIYRGLEAKFGAFPTIAFTSVLFGLVHYPGFGWPRVIAAGCLGVVFGLMRWRTGTTTASIVAHTAVNFTAASVYTALILVAAWS
jgi:CAAX protease family protein